MRQPTLTAVWPPLPPAPGPPLQQQQLASHAVPMQAHPAFLCTPRCSYHNLAIAFIRGQAHRQVSYALMAKAIGATDDVAMKFLGTFVGARRRLEHFFAQGKREGRPTTLAQGVSPETMDSERSSTRDSQRSSMKGSTERSICYSMRI